MVLGSQRSIPFPRIRIDKLVDYLKSVAEGRLSVDELKERGLDFGKGKGDLTRFFERLGVVKVDDGYVELTDIGHRLVELLDVKGAFAIHELLLSNIPQYEALVKVLKALGRAGEDELMAKVNDEVKRQYPSTWVNKVALRAMLGILKDLGIVAKKGGEYVYLGGVEAGSVNECLNRLSVTMGGEYLVSLVELSNCLGRQIDASALSNCGHLITSPGDILLKYRDPACVVMALARGILA